MLTVQKADILLTKKYRQQKGFAIKQNVQKDHVIWLDLIVFLTVISLYHSLCFITNKYQRKFAPAKLTITSICALFVWNTDGNLTCEVQGKLVLNDVLGSDKPVCY